MDLNERDKFILARWSYSIGKPIYTNAEYTLMLEYMQQMYPDDEYTTRPWSNDPCPVELLQRIGRTDLIVNVTLGDRTESIPSLNTLYEVQTELGTFSGSGTLSMKHDGWHIQANYYNGELFSMQTRGRTKDALDVSKLKQLVPKTIPALGPVRVSMEATVSRDVFGFCAQQFGNANERGAVSTLLANPEYIHMLSLHAFDIFGVSLEGQNKFQILTDWGYEVPKYFNVSDYNEIMECLTLLSDEKQGYAYPTDGAVFDGHKRRAIRLLAWEEPIYYSFVTGYMERYSLYRISPSVLIHPVLRGGTTQRRINITNWQRIIDHDLQPGSPIAFRVASSAIADFDEEATRIIRKTYEGRWEEFAERIKIEEEVKGIEWARFSNQL